MRQEFRKARWYRTMLFVPGHNLEWMLKAPKYGADALIFDLEDAVPVAQKPLARERTAKALDALKDGTFGRFVRLNGWRTGNMVEDLVAVVRSGLDGVMLPKVEDVEDITALDLLLDDLETQRGLPKGRIEILPGCETAQALYRYYDICKCSERVRRAGGSMNAVPAGDGNRALGLLDATGEGIEERSLENRMLLNGNAVLEARAAGVTQILGGMCTRIDDLELVRRVAQRARQLGASGSQVIHPSHVKILNEVFSPSVAELEQARATVVAMAEAVARGEAAARLNGRMIDYAHARSGLQLLERARSVGIDVGVVPALAVPSFDDPARP